MVINIYSTYQPIAKMSLTTLINEYNDKHGLNDKFKLIDTKTTDHCVHGDTKILTYQGYKKIKDFDGKLVSVWNGQEWSSSKVSKVGEYQKLLQVITSDGVALECTAHHKFVLNNGKIVEAHQLKIGNILMSCPFWPTIDGNDQVYEGEVPVNASIYDKRRWLARYIDEHKSTDTTLTDLVLECRSNKIAEDIKFLCNTISCSPSVYWDEWTSQVIFSPKDKHYLFQIMRLPSKYRSMETGISPNVSNLITIDALENVDGLHDIYSIDEPYKHMCVFNGIYTKN